MSDNGARYAAGFKMVDKLADSYTIPGAEPVRTGAVAVLEPLPGKLDMDYKGQYFIGPLDPPDPYAAIKNQAILDARNGIDQLFMKLEYYWFTGNYFLAEQSFGYMYYQVLKMDIQNYYFADNLTKSAQLGSRYFDSLKTMETYEPIPTPYHLAGAAVLTIAKYFNISDGMPGTETGANILHDYSNKVEARNVASGLAKFNFIMNSDYRYLMFSGYGSRAMIKELDDLKTQVQGREYAKYSTAEENAIYKKTMLDYIDRIYKMNQNNKQESNDLNDYLKIIDDEVRSEIN